MHLIFIIYLILTFIITIEAQTCTSDWSCPFNLYCPVYPPGTSPPLYRTCRTPQLSTSSSQYSYCNKNPYISSPNTNPQCRGWCDLRTNTCRDGADIGGICIPTIPRTCSSGYCSSNSLTCQRSLNNGETCTENTECSSSYCIYNGLTKTCQTNPVNNTIQNTARALALGYIIAIIISSICGISICIGICICIYRASRRPIMMNNSAQPKLMVTNVTIPQQQQPISMQLQPIYTQQQQPYAQQQQQQQQQPAYVSHQQPYAVPQQQQQQQPVQGQPMMYAHPQQQHRPMYLPQGQQPMYAPGMYPQGQAMPMYGNIPQQPVPMHTQGQPIAYGESQPYVAPPAFAPSSSSSSPSAPSAPDAFPEINKPNVESQPVSSSSSGYQPLIESSPTTTSQQ